MDARAPFRIVVFVGPSLPPADRPIDARLVWRAPAIAGDGLALLSDPPATMVLIDGLFDQSPAIRHKEILELLAAGMRVIGASSLGALRAAELHMFGMIGVGAIFDAFASGRLTGDDEVALLHGPPELGWVPVTEPLVNVRATLARAMRDRVIDKAMARRLLNAAVGVFYKDRDWSRILQETDAPVPGGDEALAAFEGWLVLGRTDLKRMDAIAGLKVALDAPGVRPPRRPPPPATLFTRELMRLSALQAAVRST